MPPEPGDNSAPSIVVTVVIVKSAATGVAAITAASRIPASRRIVKQSPWVPDGTISKQFLLFRPTIGSSSTVLTRGPEHPSSFNTDAEQISEILGDRRGGRDPRGSTPVCRGHAD